MSQTPLSDFITTLADPAALERFRSDPAAAVAAAGLSEEGRVVTSGELRHDCGVPCVESTRYGCDVTCQSLREMASIADWLKHGVWSFRS
jgi:hypothetical protein